MATTNLGRVSIVPRGSWSSAATYSRLDLVTNEGSSYLYVNTNSSSGQALTNATYWQVVASGGIPVGAVTDYAGSAPPENYLTCNGASLSAASYPALFAVIGTQYGGDGTNFNLPSVTGDLLKIIRAK